MGKYSNIILEGTEVLVDYMVKGRANSKIKERNAKIHGERLIKELDEAISNFSKFKPTHNEDQFMLIKKNMGTYIEFSGEEEYDLILKSLEFDSHGIKLMNVRNVSICDKEDPKYKTLATVYIPKGKEIVFQKKFKEYVEEKTKKGKPKNNNLVSSIKNIESAMKISAFWTGKSNDLPSDKIAWYEVWLDSHKYQVEDINLFGDVDQSEEMFSRVTTDFFDTCEKLNIAHKKTEIVFPHRSVVSIETNGDGLISLINLNSNIAELRSVSEPNNYFLNIDLDEEKGWAENLSNRLIVNEGKAFACILDTGVNYDHPLLSEFISDFDAQSVDASWGTRDNNGHGTKMAGVVAYNNLKKILLDNQPVQVNHKLESVKILPPQGFQQSASNLFGSITDQAVLLAEIKRSRVNRIFCMAISAENNAEIQGSPSSWSSGVDKICFDRNGKEYNLNWRLFFVSASNVNLKSIKEIGYFDANLVKSIEDPGQSWNALTVGAYSPEDNTSETGYSSLAKAGELSPYSATSILWDNKWPIKPEIVCDGGNVIINGQDVDVDDNLSLLTLHHDISQHLYSAICATSAATAQATYLGSELAAAYPDLWPETIRALIVHSAEWTAEMKKQFLEKANTKSGRRRLLRTCGYGVPSLDRARDCVENRVNLIIQAELQPYKMEKIIKFNKMQIHKIPWPKDVLAGLGSDSAKIKVTLSYYIEPSPGEKGWKNKYKYQSCGLRFDVKRPLESDEEFVKRINISMREEDGYKNVDNENKWYLGVQRNVGSIHSDMWIDIGANLSEMDSIAVYPVGGWWKEQNKLNRFNDKIRYALIVSIETDQSNVDLYTPIIANIKLPVSIEV